MHRGAPLQWLSAFPAEAELLFPPLTFLKPTGRTQEVVLKTAPKEVQRGWLSGTYMFSGWTSKPAHQQKLRNVKFTVIEVEPTMPSN